MSEITVETYDGRKVDFPSGSSLNDIYISINSRLDGRSIGIFDKFNKFYARTDKLPSGISSLYAYRGELAELVFHVENKIFNEVPIYAFSREFGYPYHNNLLNYAALERLIFSAFPEELKRLKQLSIDKIVVNSNVVDIFLSRGITKDSYRMIGALRLLNIFPEPIDRQFNSIGVVKAAFSKRSDARFKSQILSTWGKPSDFSELDKEIRNYKHFLTMQKEIPPKMLEGFFIDNANEIQEKGALPDAFILADKFSEYVSVEAIREKIKEMLLERPEMIKGKLIFYGTHFIWKALNSKESYKFSITPRVKSLLDRPEINQGDVAKMIVRYSSIGAGGQFTMTPRSVIEFLRDKFNIRYEGFGAPFNVDLPFCSLMYDVDLPFGTLGPFSWKQLVRRSGNWSINPPFTLKLLELSVSSILEACDHLPKNDHTQFHILFPGWQDNPWMDILTGVTQSEYLVQTIHMKLGEFSFERIDGSPLYMPFGGLVYSVFSPSGVNNPHFGAKEILEIKAKFQETVPYAVRKNLEDKVIPTWKELKEMKNAS